MSYEMLVGLQVTDDTIPKPLGNTGFSKSRNGYMQGIKFF